MGTALLFSGQGAQTVGMGKDLSESFPTARAWFNRANAALDYDLASICFNGPETDLLNTENAQPAIFLVSWIAFELLKEQVPILAFAATGVDHREHSWGERGGCGETSARQRRRGGSTWANGRARLSERLRQ